MNDEILENYLRGLPAPELPPEWEEPLLATAWRQAQAISPRENGPAVLLFFRNLFVHHPFTSGALAALWMLIAFFHSTTPADEGAKTYLVKLEPGQPVYLTSLDELSLVFELETEEPVARPMP